MMKLHYVLTLQAALVLTGCGSEQKVVREGIPEWVVYPDKAWQTITPEEAGINDLEAWNTWVSSTKEKVKGDSFYRSSRARGTTRKGEDHSGSNWGVAIARGGYLLQTFGDPEFKFQTASLGKSFTLACLQLAIEDGLIGSADDLIKDVWTGEGQLNHPHKYLNQGHHNSLTFSHLANHVGGFPITNGESWKACNDYDRVAFTARSLGPTGFPEWANCTGDADHDNYAHAEPDSVGWVYSSGGYWRLAQALTALWKKDLKVVMDERLFSKMGIPADRWDWTPGQKVREDPGWYPTMPGYGLFLDPPYEIDGNVVRGGPGWIVMSAKDLARVGLLVATRGVWKGERLISGTSFLRGHGGGNASHMTGVGGDLMVSWGKVTTSDIDFDDLPVDLFVEQYSAIERRGIPSQ